MRRLALPALVAVALCASCSSTSTGSGVPWTDYAPSVRTRIDGLAASKDCAGLQAEFDQADANNASTKARTGHNNAALMTYINDLLVTAGCQ